MSNEAAPALDRMESTGAGSGTTGRRQACRGTLSRRTAMNSTLLGVGPRLIGRFELSNPAAPVFAWSGTAISLRFVGNALGVTLGDAGNNVFEVVLDGEHNVLCTEPGTKTYRLGHALGDGPHEVLLYRRTEASFGETTFNGFDVAESAYLPQLPAPSRRLEVIGDSISAGYGNEGVFPSQFTAATENHYLSYGAIAARALGAELFTAAWSGIGMVRSYDGSTSRTMPLYYPRTLPERDGSAWDFSRFVPNAVVINLGTNDFALGDPGIAFQHRYARFVQDLRVHYPEARFFLAIGPMLAGASYEQAAAYLRGVLAERARGGDQNLTVLELGRQDATADGVGCDYHPSLKTHGKLADRLIEALKADLGW